MEKVDQGRNGICSTGAKRLYCYRTIDSPYHCLGRNLLGNSAGYRRSRCLLGLDSVGEIV